jgi:hypothetical protein
MSLDAPPAAPVRAAAYSRVSTLDQEPENQLAELRRYAAARGWTLTEFVDRGISGAKDRRPALDQLLAAARRRKCDVLVCWRLDRLGRSLRHLIMLIQELQHLGIAFVSLNEGIDATTPAGRYSFTSSAPSPSSSAPASESGSLRACAWPRPGGSSWGGHGGDPRRRAPGPSRCRPAISRPPLAPG